MRAQRIPDGKTKTTQLRNETAFGPFQCRHPKSAKEKANRTQVSLIQRQQCAAPRSPICDTITPNHARRSVRRQSWTTLPGPCLVTPHAARNRGWKMCWRNPCVDESRNPPFHNQAPCFLPTLHLDQPASPASRSPPQFSLFPRTPSPTTTSFPPRNLHSQPFSQFHDDSRG